jgi:hypothetical protein
MALLPTVADIKNSIGAMGNAIDVGIKQRKVLANQVLGFTQLNDATMLLNRGLDAQIGMNQELIDTYVGLAAKSLVFEARNKDLNKTFGISSMGAAKLSMTLHTLANEQGFSGAQAIKYASSIKKLLPSLEQQGKEHDKTYESLQRIQHVLTTNLGITEEATSAYTLYASKNGENADATMQFASSLAAVLGDEDGTMGYMKQAIEGIAEAGAETQLQFGKLPGNLEVATIKAKALGFELDDLATAGNHLLDIESSIGQELEYQLLSGHRLVGNEKASEKLRGKSLTNAYREATLRGNMSDAASTLNTILDQEGEVLENNLFARKQMADLMGIEEGQLSRALQKKKLLSSDEGLSVLMKLDGTELERTAKAMLDNNQLSQEKFNELTKLNDTRTTDDIMKQQLVVAHESLATFKTMLSEEQLKNVTIQRDVLTNETGIQGIQSLMLDLKQPEMATLGRTDAIDDKLNMFEKAKTAITTSLKQYQSDETKALEPVATVGGSDTVVPPGFGSRVLTFPEDTLQPNIAFNNKDNIMATTLPPTFDGGPANQPIYGGDMSQSSGNNSSAEYLSLAKALAENNSSATPGAATDAGIMAMGRMIVAAINAKGSNLFGKTSMNDSIYPS